jgi:hypothetical protein
MPTNNMVPATTSHEPRGPEAAGGAPTMVWIDDIRTDGGTQPRASIDYHAVEDYADAMGAGAKFPPVVLFFDSTTYWLADGFHRVQATIMAGGDEIAAEVRQGTQSDAQWYSFAANKTNGLRRTNDDKQRAVKAALAHPKAAGMSDRKIAEYVGVHYNTVAEYRKATITKGDSEPRCRTGRDGRTINTQNIGKPPRQPQTVHKAEQAILVAKQQPELLDDGVVAGTTKLCDTEKVARGKVNRPIGKRQQILANAGRNRMIAVISNITGSCRGLRELDISGCTPEERQEWARIARKHAKELREFAARLETEPYTAPAAGADGPEAQK